MAFRAYQTYTIKMRMSVIAFGMRSLPANAVVGNPNTISLKYLLPRPLG